MTEREALAVEATTVALQLAEMGRTGPEGRVNRPLLRALAEAGLLPRLFPRRAGGSRDRDVLAVDLCAVREALAAAHRENR